MAEEHAAKKWVEEHYPFWDGYLKAALILAYGAGLDAGLAEAQEIVEEAAEKLGIDFSRLQPAPQAIAPA